MGSVVLQTARDEGPELTVLCSRKLSRTAKNAGNPKIRPVLRFDPIPNFDKLSGLRFSTNLSLAMKSDIHPNYRPVVFKDKTADFSILTQSTINTNETIKWEDGNEYPVYFVDISSASHPFYTGKQQFVDTMGRVEKFKKKFAGNYKSLEKKTKK